MIKLDTGKYCCRCQSCGKTSKDSNAFRQIKISPENHGNSLVVGPLCRDCLKDLAGMIVAEL